MTTNRKVAKATVILIAISMFGYVLSIAKEMLIADSFGIAKSVDAFYSALTVSNMAGNLLMGAFSTLFIPIFVKQLLTDKREANILASVAINYLFIGLLVFTGGILIFAHPVISFSFRGLDAETTVLTARILQVLSITIVCMGAVGVVTGIMNSYEQFSAPALSQILINVCIIAFVWFSKDNLGIFSLVWGNTVGFVFQALMLCYLVKRTGFEYSFTFDLRQPALKGIAGFIMVYILSSIVFIGNSLVNRVMASYLPGGSIAALAYADKLVQVPMIIFAGSISTAIYPFFARQFAENELEQLKDTFASGVKMSGFLFIPTAVFIIIFSRSLIYVLFQRGAFDLRATELTSVLMVCYSFQLFYVYISAIMIKVLFTVQDFKNILKVSSAGLLLSIIFNAVFMKLINPPAAGIAISTSLSGLAVCIMYFYYLKRRMAYLHGISIALFLLKVSAMAFLVGILLKAFEIFYNRMFAVSLVNQLCLLGISAVLGSFLFAVLAYALKIEEVRRLHALASNWWKMKWRPVHEN